MYHATIGNQPLRLSRSGDVARQGDAAAQRRSCWPASPRHRARSGWPRNTRSPTCRCAPFSKSTSCRTRQDEVTRLIIDTHDAAAFAPIAHLTVGGLRDWLLSDAATTETLTALAPGVTPEMAAAVSKISRLQDLMVMAAKCSVVTRFRNTIGLPGRLSVRLQPNHPTDDLAGIAASILDGLLLGSGDAVIGINPATDSPERAHALGLDARRGARQARHPDPELRARACDHDARAHRHGARRSTSYSSRSPARRRRTGASASTSRSSPRRTPPRWRSGAAPSATT